jgi:hypothetical protein
MFRCHLNKMLYPPYHFHNNTQHLVSVDGYITQRNVGRMSLWEVFNLKDHPTILKNMHALTTLEHIANTKVIHLTIMEMRQPLNLVIPQ